MCEKKLETFSFLLSENTWFPLLRLFKKQHHFYMIHLFYCNHLFQWEDFHFTKENHQNYSCYTSHKFM